MTQPSASPPRWRRLLLVIGVLGVLGAVDTLCVATGWFLPRYEYGLPNLGWAPRTPGHAITDWCIENESGRRIEYARNALGIRTSRTVETIAADTARFVIAAVGDSHSDLCMPNDSTHQGVLESSLTASGIPTTVLSYGQGRYSPLQAYLLYRTRLEPLTPDALVLNLYSGNDFYDILRVDDRPHFADSAGTYVIRPPVWFSLDDPSEPGWMRQSRLVWFGRSAVRATGLPRLIQRVSLLYGLANVYADSSIGRSAVVSNYLKDIQGSMADGLGYPAAYSAQILNQALFFHHFPRARAESLRRTRYLLRRIRAEQRGRELLFSPIPSYVLVGDVSADSAFGGVMQRMPFSVTELRSMELALVREAEQMAREEGWLIADNVETMQRGHAPAELFNRFDYHVNGTASAIIGRLEAEALRSVVSKR